MPFNFGGINPTVKLKDQEKIVKDIRLYSEDRGRGNHLLFLVEYPLDERATNALAIWIRQN